MPAVEALDGLVATLPRDEQVALLREDHPAHDGRSRAATARTRALALAALGGPGCPAAALAVVIEELETGDEPLLVAAAARVAAGLGRDLRDPGLAAALASALGNTAGLDDVVDLDAVHPAWPPERPTTALAEVLGALRVHGDARVRDRLAALRRDRAHLLGPADAGALDDVIAGLGPAPCCHASPPSSPPSSAEPETEPVIEGPVIEGPVIEGPVPAHIEVEDCDGARFPLAGFLHRAPTVVAFFYTRCDNPRKCSLTITSLAELARDLGERGALGAVQVAAITYDPGYDLPARLRRYGVARGFPVGPAATLLRAPDDHGALAEHLRLRVGYAGSAVSRHAVELYLLDRTGTVVATRTRRRWDPAEVRDALLALRP